MLTSSQLWGFSLTKDNYNAVLDRFHLRPGYEPTTGVATGGFSTWEKNSERTDVWMCTCVPWQARQEYTIPSFPGDSQDLSSSWNLDTCKSAQVGQSKPEPTKIKRGSRVDLPKYRGMCSLGMEYSDHFIAFCGQEFLILSKIQTCKHMWRHRKSVAEYIW